MAMAGPTWSCYTTTEAQPASSGWNCRRAAAWALPPPGGHRPPAPGDATRSKLSVGDFNGDGKSDVGILYDYGSSNSKFWVFTSTGSSFAAPVNWWTSNPGGWSWSASKLGVGDFNADGKADMGVLYDYGGANTKFWVGISTGSAFNAPTTWWTSNPGGWDQKLTQVGIGDFNGDGKSDVGMLYDLDGSDAKFWVAKSTGTALVAPTTWWSSTTWDASASKLGVGDYNGDGKADMGVFYDYGGATTRLWVATSTGTTLNAPSTWWESAEGNWEWNNSKLGVADYTGDGKADLGVLYTYGGASTKFFGFVSTGTAVTAPTAWWTSTTWAWANTQLG